PRGTTPYNGYSSWVLQPLGNNRYLVKWYSNQNYCMNIPGGIQNRRLTLWQCNSNDSDQVFTITNVNTTPPPPTNNYVFPYSNGQIGALEAANGKRLFIADSELRNGGSTGLTGSTNYTQTKMQLLTNGYGYVVKRAGTNFGLSSITKTPYSSSQTHVYQSGFNGYQSFRLVDLGYGYYQWKFYEDDRMCLDLTIYYQ
ncbi:MAG: hypothetical protein HC932_05555, partial [Thermales bacterium]|nr:hypothetical protein [Thermales bacterium]